MKKHTHDQLLRMYTDGEIADKSLFAEQRSSLLLIAGEHYSRKNSNYWNSIREDKSLPREQKLRLTKNHVQKITKTLTNNIVSYAPGVSVTPNNEKEAQDRKSASLNQAVWEYGKKTQRIKEKTDQWAHDYIGVGEVATRIYWDEDEGEFLGMEQAVDPQGQPIFDENGEPVAGDTAAFSGDLVFERIYGFNLIRPKGASDLQKAPWICHRKMVPVDIVRSWVRDDEDKQKKISESEDETFYVFEAVKNGYDKAKDQVMVLEFYFRPCKAYPQGYYYIQTKTCPLYEGELPFGVFPIVYTGYDAIQTSPRHRGIVKQLRPYQIEINRAASKIAEHQTSLGDDKLLVQNGSKIKDGISLPGVREIRYTGRMPEVLSGRSGEQYLGYMQNQIEEMYGVANVQEDTREKEQGADSFAQLFKSMKDRKKFILYAEKFERFLMDVCETYLRLAKHYFDENHLIPMVGKNEYVNISEFKNTDPISYQVNLEARANDLETQFGKQLVMNHALQFVGGQLSQQDIGKLIRNMPFGNLEENFNDLTMDYDMAENMLLALDRGEQFQPNPYDDHTYMIKRLVHRMRQPDFAMLEQPIQQQYHAVKDQYEQIEADQQRKLLAAQNEFIPTGGAKVKVDFYIPKKGNPEKSERATLPAEAINWLVQRLADQGTSQERLEENIPQGAMSEIADLTFPPGGGQAGSPPQGGQPR